MSKVSSLSVDCMADSSEGAKASFSICKGSYFLVTRPVDTASLGSQATSSTIIS